MFADNGPVGAAKALRSYIATNGLNSFPEAACMALSALIETTPIETIIIGSERLFAALVELEGMPDRPGALQALGEAGQQIGLHGFGGDAARGYLLMTWAEAELGEGAASTPEVNATYSFVLPEPGA